MKNTTQPQHTSIHRATALLGAIAILTGSIAFADEIDIKVNAVTYLPFSNSLAAGTPIYLNADNNPAIDNVRAMQRSLGYREVDYKAAFSTSLNWSPLAPANITSAGGVTTYDYSGQSNVTTDLVGFWTSKDLPIIIGPDGKAYTTDGHHTTAGYLASTPVAPRLVLPGMEHVVVGHVIANYFDPANPVAPDDAFWLARQSENRAFLFGPNGSPLTQPTDPGYGAATQPILPSVLAMPIVPGKAGMTLDSYRSLAWGMVDGVAKSATTSAGAKITGFKKTNPLTPGVDTNFVEFYWADFLRNRVGWEDAQVGSALGSGMGDANLIKAPLSFFTAGANGIALAKSEAYRDQFGRSLADYDSPAHDANTRSWAHASIVNGLAKAGETYHMYLRDDSTVYGNITPSALSNNKLHIDTKSVSNMQIDGVISNFSSVTINGGGTLQTSWKDAALNTPAFNSTLTLAPGTETVEFTAANTYTGTTDIIAGQLLLSGAGSISHSSVISVAPGASFGSLSPLTIVSGQTLKNNGGVAGAALDVRGTISGTGVFIQKVTIENGAHLAPGNSPGTLSFSGGLTLEQGSVLDFDLGTNSDLARILGGIFDGSDTAGTTVNFTFGPGFVPGSTFTLFDWNGASAIDVDAADFVAANGLASFAVVGNTLRATVVPEPGVLALLGLSLASLLGQRRREWHDA